MTGRIIFGIALGYLLLGIAGFSGSSGLWAVRNDKLLTRDERARGAREVLGTSRDVRSDEWAVDQPLSRAQQLARPSFPLVNPGEGLGQLARVPGSVPTLDWGTPFRPWTWPLLLGTRWSLGVRWFLRDFALLLGLYGWMLSYARRSGTAGATAPPPDAAIAGFAAIAVFYSSGVSWWMAASMEPFAFAGLAVAAIDARERASSPLRRIMALAAAAWCATCTFFWFYAPLWGPMLWLLCGSIIDVPWRATRDWRHTARRAAPAIVAVALAVVLGAAYYSPFLAVVAETVYPGRRIASAGGMPVTRLLDLAFPSLTINASIRGTAAYIGSTPGMNVCEAAGIEATPLLFLLALTLVSRRIRVAVVRAIAAHPFTALAWSVLAAWLLVPLPGLFGDVTLLRWSPWGRAWLAFGLGSALLTTGILAELARDRDATPSWREAVSGAALAVIGLVLAYHVAPGPARPVSNAVRHWTPIVGSVSLLVAGLATLHRRRGTWLIAASWAIPLVIANVAVNPLVRSRDLLREGTGHAVVHDALVRVPGRLLTYSKHPGAVLAGFGYPVLPTVQLAPDVDLWRWLEPEVPGLREEVFNRFAHASAVLPPAETRLVSPDFFWVALPPCSARLAALGVNHVLTKPDEALPSACRDDFSVQPAGELSLWTRRRPVNGIGVGRSENACDPLTFDWRATQGVPSVEWRRAGLTVRFPPGAKRPAAIPLNLALIESVQCSGATAQASGAHLIVTPDGEGAGRCDAAYLGTAGALRRLVTGRGPRIEGVAQTAAVR